MTAGKTVLNFAAEPLQSRYMFLFPESTGAMSGRTEMELSRKTSAYCGSRTLYRIQSSTRSACEIEQEVEQHEVKTCGGGDVAASRLQAVLRGGRRKERTRRRWSRRTVRDFCFAASSSCERFCPMSAVSRFSSVIRRPALISFSVSNSLPAEKWRLFTR